MNLQLLVSLLSAVIIGVILFRKWLWKGAKLLARTALGGAVLAVLAQCSGWTGITLGVNLVNAAVLGVLGVPGFALLLLLQQVTAG